MSNNDISKAKTNHGSDEWYTPKYIFDALGVVFDVDVACPKDLTYINTPAKEFISENSLEVKWEGLVWCNPPFKGKSKEAKDNKNLWLNKFFNHGNGLLLLPDSTSADWWHRAAAKCDALLFTKTRVGFIMPNGKIKGGNPGGTTIFASGDVAVAALYNAVNLGMTFVGSRG